MDVDVSIIIVNWNTRELLLACLESVYRSIHGLTFEVWVVDNASEDGSVTSARGEHPGILVIENKTNLGFAAANNLALEKMSGRYALLLNTDAVLTDGAVKTLFDFMEATPKAALACGQLLNPDGSKQNSVANFPSLVSLLTNETVLRLLLPHKYPSKTREYADPIEIDSCIGACMILRKKTIEDVGYLDERYFFFLEETDWAYRMKGAGWRVFFVPHARIFHAQGQSVGHGISSRITFYRSRYIYFKKWRPRTHRLYDAVIVIRLLVETCLSTLGTVMTLGQNRRMKEKLLVYLKLVLWHLKGCP